MTGTIKSNRCGTCRKRKVKCDEVKPVCGPCQKGKRTCEVPISRFKFARLKEPPLDVNHAVDTREAPEPCTRITTIRATETGDGAYFQTLRFARTKKPSSSLSRPEPADQVLLARSPPLSAVHSLQLVLLETFSCHTLGLRLSLISGYIREIPRRIGHSAALDNAIACLVNCHAMLCDGDLSKESLKQNRLHAKALFTLRMALEDPIEGRSDNTLAAVIVLSLIEQFGGGMQGAWPKYVEHAGGASKMAQVLGPKHFQTPFSKSLFVACRNLGFVAALVSGEDCFMNEPQWRNVDVVEVHMPVVAWVLDDLSREICAIPSLIRRIRRYYTSPTGEESSKILRDAQQIRRALQQVSDFVEEKVDNNIDIIELPSAYSDEMFPTVYQFSTQTLASLCVIYWGISMVLDRIIKNFLSSHASAAVAATLNARITHTRRQICMSYEHSEQFWPLGSAYMITPFIIAYHGATEDEKLWMMHKLWKIGMLIPRSQEFWGPVALEVQSRMFIGLSFEDLLSAPKAEDSWEARMTMRMKKFQEG